MKVLPLRVQDSNSQVSNLVVLWVVLLHLRAAHANSELETGPVVMSQIF